MKHNKHCNGTPEKRAYAGISVNAEWTKCSVCGYEDNKTKKRKNRQEEEHCTT